MERHRFRLDAPVYQCRVGLLQSPRLWHLVDNRFYDLKILRRLIRKAFLRYHNITSNERSVGRFIVRGIKPA
jgi:hypothetical protein